MSAHEFYSARAAEAREDADKTTLDNVRDRCLRSAAAWEAMAARARHTDDLRAKREADKSAADENDDDGRPGADLPHFSAPQAG